MKQTLLCATADEALRALVSRALLHEVVYAGTAIEAHSLVRARVFHGYILDPTLRDLSAIALCRRIRRTDPAAPIVFRTATADAEARAEALRAGASLYLCGPMDPGQFASTFNGLLDLALAYSLKARIDEEAAVLEALLERHRRAVAASEKAKARASHALEQTAKVRAFIAYVEAGGSRAHFETWWPEIYGQARVRPAPNYERRNRRAR